MKKNQAIFEAITQQINERNLVEKYNFSDAFKNSLIPYLK